MAVIIATATEREMAATLSGLGELPEIDPGRLVEWSWRGRDWLLLVTGVGLVNAGISLGQSVNLAGQNGNCLEVDGVVNPGIAGSYDLDRFPLGSTVVAEQEIWPEYGIGGGDLPDAKALGFPLYGQGQDAIWDRISLDPDVAARQMDLNISNDWHRTTGVSVSTVTADEDRARLLAQALDAGMENMEGFSLALGCKRVGVPFLEVRTISNLAGSRDRAYWNIREAMKALGRIMPILAGSR